MAAFVRLLSFNLSSVSTTLNSHHQNQLLYKNSKREVTESCLSSDFIVNSRFAIHRAKQPFQFKIHATITETEQPKWWERNGGPNMIDIHSTQEFVNALGEAGDKLVIVEFYGTWCASCRALYPKLCKTAQEHPEILFLKVNFDENKPMCKNLNVKKIKDAIQTHITERCSIGPIKGVGDVNLEKVSSKPAESPP